MRQIVYIVSQVIWSASSERSVCTYCYEEEYECRARRTRRLRDAHHAQKPDSLVVEYMHGVHVVSYLQKPIYHSSGRTILPDWEQQEYSDLTACARRVKVSQSWCILVLPETFVKPSFAHGVHHQAELPGVSHAGRGRHFAYAAPTVSIVPVPEAPPSHARLCFLFLTAFRTSVCMRGLCWACAEPTFASRLSRRGEFRCPTATGFFLLFRSYQTAIRYVELEGRLLTVFSAAQSQRARNILTRAGDYLSPHSFLQAGQCARLIRQLGGTCHRRPNMR